MLWCVTAKISDPSNWHAHDVVEFALCRSTGGFLVIDDGRIDLVENRTILIPPRTRHSYAPGQSPVEMKFFCLTSADVGAHLSPSQAAALSKLCAAGVSVADHLPGAEAVALADLIKDGLGDRGCAAQVHWGAFNLLLAFHADKLHPPPGHPSTRYREKMEKVLAWLDEHICEDISLEIVASDFGMSRSLFIREFRRHAGMSFVEYCSRKRGETAALLLASTAKPVADTAFESGWGNLSHFHREFKRQYGLTPSAFRRKIVEEGGF
jgi:AraC-like DNA-binding protein